MVGLATIADYAELVSDLTSTASNQALTAEARSLPISADQESARSQPAAKESPRPRPADRNPLRRRAAGRCAPWPKLRRAATRARLFAVTRARSVRARRPRGRESYARTKLAGRQVFPRVQRLPP